jgi:hypothetical protein
VGRRFTGTDRPCAEAVDTLVNQASYYVDNHGDSIDRGEMRKAAQMLRRACMCSKTLTRTRKRRVAGRR